MTDEQHPGRSAGVELAPDAPVLAAALRSGTRQAHDRIESALALERLADEGPPAAAARYGRVLQAFALFHRHWQPRLAAALPQALAPWLTGAPRQDWLAADLLALGLAPPPADAADPTRHLAPLLAADACAALGSLYVIEGSALGGQVIVHALGRQMPQVAATASRYFQGHGALTGARWRQFGTLLAQAVPPGPDAAASIAHAVRAAEATFDALLQATRTQQAMADALAVGAP